jgi:hypothetical protein
MFYHPNPYDCVFTVYSVQALFPLPILFSLFIDMLQIICRKLANKEQ